MSATEQLRKQPLGEAGTELVFAAAVRPEIRQLALWMRELSDRLEYLEARLSEWEDRGKA